MAFDETRFDADRAELDRLNEKRARVLDDVVALAGIRHDACSTYNEAVTRNSHGRCFDATRIATYCVLHRATPGFIMLPPESRPKMRNPCK